MSLNILTRAIRPCMYVTLLAVWTSCVRQNDAITTLYDPNLHLGEQYATSLHLTIQGPDGEQVTCAQQVTLSYQGKLRWSMLTGEQHFPACNNLLLWIGFRGFHINKQPKQAPHYSPAAALVVLNDGQQICPLAWSRHVAPTHIWCYPLQGEHSGWHITIGTTIEPASNAQLIEELTSYAKQTATSTPNPQVPPTKPPEDQ